MKASVIIPVYNRAHLIENAINSVLLQTQYIEEIIVVDDGSTDGLSAIVANYPLVKYIYQANSGVSSARNLGIYHCKSEWIALLDSDDIWLKDKLKRQFEALKLSQKLICHSNEVWVENGILRNQKAKHKRHAGWIFEQCLKLCAISPSTSLIHRSIFHEIGQFDESLVVCEDYDLWLRITAKYPVELVDDALVIKHGGHEDQLSSAYWGMDRFRIQSLEKIYSQNTLSEEQCHQLLIVLVKKISIYLKGLKKRDKQAEVEVFISKQEYYQQKLNVFLI